MKIPAFIIVSMLTLCVWEAEAQTSAASAADQAAIKQTALDYIEGWYEGNAERMERAVHPNLAKRIVRTNSQGQSRFDQMGSMALVQGTKSGGGKQTPRVKQQKEVTILDVFENAASVKIVASDWIDYLHLARFNGSWVIVNVLWELKPKSLEPEKSLRQLALNIRSTGTGFAASHLSVEVKSPVPKAGLRPEVSWIEPKSAEAGH